MGIRAYRPARTAACAALAAGILAGAAACSSPEGRSGAPAPGPTTPADICTSLVAYWAEEALEGSTWAGLDWEQKGLSNEQLAIHDEALAAARAEEKRNGRPAAVELIRRQVRQKCEAQNGATGSSENWRPPR
ncbi:hypothetical protein [Streptomyces formicae]|uniref:Lipoprotein n=1 Tax=Streptomyces formicae TaxID=1616117 RepID=A0ABY3WP82_9ACTN|nr:hypothetical protein [Streptomyces formicae]UNM14444.1 hypothetical protein J4032_25910 [Streptomyces formicae]